MNNSNDNNLNINSLNEKNISLDLLKNELEINAQEQVLLNKKINLIKETIKMIPNTDPQAAILITHLEMYQIELDELKSEEENLKENIQLYS